MIFKPVPDILGECSEWQALGLPWSVTVSICREGWCDQLRTKGFPFEIRNLSSKRDEQEQVDAYLRDLKDALHVSLVKALEALG